MSIDYVVSLGAWCQTTFQIKNHGLPLLPSCFDWLVTPWSGLLNILKTEGKSLALSGEPFLDGTSVICPEYGVLYHHEFPHDDEGRVILDSEGFTKARSKLLHKYERMHRTLSSHENETALFVRYGAIAEPPAAWPYLTDHASFEPDRLNDLLAILQAKYPNKRVRLMFVWPSPFTSLSIDNADLHPDIFAQALPPPSGEVTWFGEHGPWGEAFNSAFEKWGLTMRAIHQNIATDSLGH